MAQVAIGSLTVTQIATITDQAKREALFGTILNWRDLFDKAPGLATQIGPRIKVDDVIWTIAYEPEPGDLEVNIGMFFPHIEE
jgi:hypothetical protein